MLVAILFTLLACQIERPSYPALRTAPPGVADYEGDVPVPHEIPLATLSTLTVSVDKAVYEVGETVAIDVTVTNTAKKSFVCHCTPLRFMVDIEYRVANEPFRLLKPTPMPLPIGVHALYRLEPTQAVGERTIAVHDFGTGAPFLARPGRYQVRATYYDDYEKRAPSSMVESRPLEFDVVAPSNRAAYAAYRGALNVMAAGSFDGRLADDALLARASDFVDRFCGSPYAYRVMVVLVDSLRHRLHHPDGRPRAGVTPTLVEMYNRHHQSLLGARQDPLGHRKPTGQN